MSTNTVLKSKEHFKHVPKKRAVADLEKTGKKETGPPKKKRRLTKTKIKSKSKSKKKRDKKSKKKERITITKLIRKKKIKI